MALILLADDERMVRESMRNVLVGMGYDVALARDGRDALEKFRQSRPDLVLLDVMMPKGDGFKVCEQIRATDKAVPVIFLTGKDSEADQIRGLGVGADDYVSKDSGPALLLARIARALKRVDDSKLSEGAMPAERTLQIGEVRIDDNLLTASVGGKLLARLTRTEYQILAVLANGKGKIHSAVEIINSLRGDGFACEDGMLYVHISNVRRKLGKFGKMIVNVPSLGYMVE